MFSFKKKQTGETIKLKISGMHCTSCAMTVDGTLEDLDGVHESTTNYAKQTTEVMYDPKKISFDTLKKAVEALGYSADKLTS